MELEFEKTYFFVRYVKNGDIVYQERFMNPDEDELKLVIKYIREMI